MARGLPARVVRTLLAGLIASSAVTVAQAYYSSTGNGSGAAGTGTLAGSVTLSAADLSGELYPGQTAGVALTATNPNAAEVFIGSLALDTSQGSGGFAIGAANAGCALTAFSFTTQNNGGDGWTIPANGSLSIALPDAVSASATTAGACQSGTLTVYLKAAG